MYLSFIFVKSELVKTLRFLLMQIDSGSPTHSCLTSAGVQKNCCFSPGCYLEMSLVFVKIAFEKCVC